MIDNDSNTLKISIYWYGNCQSFHICPLIMIAMQVWSIVIG
jgi:hypothetical protein